MATMSDFYFRFGSYGDRKIIVFAKFLENGWSEADELDGVM